MNTALSAITPVTTAKPVAVKRTRISTPPDASNSSRMSHGALRVVSTKALSRDEWLEARKQGIGSSDAVAVGKTFSPKHAIPQG